MEASSMAPLRKTVFASLLAALISAGAYAAIPIGPVPIVLQNLFVLLAGLLLGPAWGLASVLVYLFLGAVGLPVFSGGGSGPAHFAGPTGGYLLGYIPAVVAAGWISRRHNSYVRDLAGAACGSLIVYAAGVPWLIVVTGLSFGKALAVGLLPFLPGDALKVAACLPLARYLRPLALGTTDSGNPP